MIKKIKNYVASSILLGASLVSSCTAPNNPIGPTPDTNDRCVTGTAVDYASQIDLPLDVRVLDSNNDVMRGCFTNHEQSWLNELKAIESEGILTAMELQNTVDQFETVGPMLPVALRLSYQGFKEDRQYEPDVIRWKPDHLGWVPLDIILPDASLPGRYHSLDFPAITNYPINMETTLWGLADWKNLIQGDTSTFLSEFGACAECTTAEDVSNIGSIDMLMEREFQDGELLKLYYPIYNGTLTPGVVDNILIGPLDGNFGIHDDTTIGVRYDIHPDDRSLFDADYVRYTYAHISPNNEKFYDASDYDFKVGDIIMPGQFIGYVSHYGPFELDFTLSAPSNFGFGPYTNFIRSGQLTRSYVLDIPGSRYYPEGKRPNPTQPRYSQDNRVYYHFPLSEGGYIPEPSEP